MLETELGIRPQAVPCHWKGLPETPQDMLATAEYSSQNARHLRAALDQSGVEGTEAVCDEHHPVQLLKWPRVQSMDWQLHRWSSVQNV